MLYSIKVCYLSWHDVDGLFGLLLNGLRHGVGEEDGFLVVLARERGLCLTVHILHRKVNKRRRKRLSLFINALKALIKLTHKIHCGKEGKKEVGACLKKLVASV